MINFKMNNGNTIPALGYGVFQMTGEEVRQHLPEAIELGFRHIDTANAYFNEVAVGEVVKASDIARRVLCDHEAVPTGLPVRQV